MAKFTVRLDCQPLWLWPGTIDQFGPHPQALWHVMAKQFKTVQYLDLSFWVWHMQGASGKFKIFLADLFDLFGNKPAKLP